MTRADDIAVTNNKVTGQGHGTIRTEIVELLYAARAASVRSIKALMTATYWKIGRRIVEFEQSGGRRAQYGEELIKRLAGDLTRQFGRGFGAVNLSQMRRFCIEWPPVALLIMWRTSVLTIWHNDSKPGERMCGPRMFRSSEAFSG